MPGTRENVDRWRCRLGGWGFGGVVVWGNSVIFGVGVGVAIILCLMYISK